jgi:twitching motility protein PilU
LLVVGAITAQNAEDAIPRLINLFPESERKLRARIFSRVLQGILSLKLFARADGEGQVPASELLIANTNVKRLIEEANLSALHAQVAKGASEGMQTFAQSIERLVETGLIRGEEAARELERLGAVTSPRIGAPPAVAKPAPAPSSRASGETPAPAPDAGQPEGFGEEDTLMNWL